MKNVDYALSRPISSRFVALVAAIITAISLVFAAVAVWRMSMQSPPFSQRTVLPVLISIGLMLVAGGFLYFFLQRTFCLRGVRFQSDGKLELIHRNGARTQCLIPAQIESVYVRGGECFMKLRCKRRLYVIADDQIRDRLVLRQFLAEQVPAVADMLKDALEQQGADVLISFQAGQPIRTERMRIF